MITSNKYIKLLHSFALIAFTFIPFGFSQDNVGAQVDEDSASTNPVTITLTPETVSKCVGETVKFDAVLNHATASSWTWIVTNAAGADVAIDPTIVENPTTSSLEFEIPEEGIYKIQALAAGAESNIGTLTAFENFKVTINKELICTGETVTICVKSCNSENDEDVENIDISVDNKVLRKVSHSLGPDGFCAVYTSLSPAQDSEIRVTVNGDDTTYLYVTVTQLEDIKPQAVVYDLVNNSASVKLVGVYKPVQHTAIWSVTDPDASFVKGANVKNIQATDTTLFVDLVPGVLKRVKVKAQCGLEPVFETITFLIPLEGEEFQIFVDDKVCIDEEIIATSKEFDPEYGWVETRSNWSGVFGLDARFTTQINNTPSVKIKGLKKAEALPVTADQVGSSATDTKYFDVIDGADLDGPDRICIEEKNTLTATVCSAGSYLVVVRQGITLDGLQFFTFTTQGKDAIDIEMVGQKAGNYKISMYKLNGESASAESPIATHDVHVIESDLLVGDRLFCPGETNGFTAVVCSDSEYKVVLGNCVNSDGVQQFTFNGPENKNFDVTAVAQGTCTIELYRINNESGGSGEETLAHTVTVEVTDGIKLKRPEQTSCFEIEQNAPKKYLSYCVEICDLTLPDPVVFISPDNDQILKRHGFAQGEPLKKFRMGVDERGNPIKIYAFWLEVAGEGDAQVWVEAGPKESNKVDESPEAVYLSWNLTKNAEWEDILHFMDPGDDIETETVEIEMRDENGPAPDGDITWQLAIQTQRGACITPDLEIVRDPNVHFIPNGSKVKLTYEKNPNKSYQVVAIFECQGEQYVKDHNISTQLRSGTSGKRTIPFAPSSKYRNLTIHGQPATTVKPQKGKESDQPSSRTNIDAYNLSLTHSLTDVSIPLRGSDLRLEFRRTSSVDTKMVPDLCQLFQQPDPYKDILGYGWRTNLTAHIQKHAKGFIVSDEDGASHEYDEHKRPKKSSFSNQDSSRHTLSQEDNLLVWTKMHGTTYVFEPYRQSESLNTGRGGEDEDSTPCDEILQEILNENGGGSGGGQLGLRAPDVFYRLISVTDRNGNEIRYSYVGNAPFPVLMYYAQNPQVFIQFVYDSSNNSLKNVIDPLGRTYTYNVSGQRLLSVVAPSVPVATEDNPKVTVDSSPVSTYTYETLQGYSNGYLKNIICLSSITDAEENTISFEYQVISDNLGNSNAHLKTVNTPNLIDGSASFELVNSNDSRTVTVTDTRDNVWVYNFSTSETSIPFVTAIPGSDEEAFKEFALDDFSRSINTNNQNYTMTADFTAGDHGEINLTEVTDYFGNSIKYSYEGIYSKYGLVTKEVIDEGGLNITKKFDYGTHFKMSKIVDPRGIENGNEAAFTTTYAFDISGNRITEFAPEGKETHFSYEMGFKTKVIDADGRTTLSKRFYHDQGWDDVNVTLLTYGDTRTYEDLNIDYEDYTTSPSDDIILIVKKFDLVGNLTKAIDANGNITENVFDDMNSLITTKLSEIEDFDSSEFKRPQILLNRDLNRQIIGRQDARANWTLTQYDEMLRPIKEVIEFISDPTKNIITETGYDNSGNKSFSIDPRGVRYEFEYNAFNNIVKEVSDVGVGEDFLNFTTTYFYGDNSGNDLFGDSGFVPTKKIDARGIVTLLEYDNAYRLKKTKRGRPGFEVELNLIDYDAAGNVTRTVAVNDRIANIDGDYVEASDALVSGNQETITLYDNLNRPVLTAVNLNGEAADFTDSGDIITQTFYDLAGNIVKVVDPEGHSTQTEYDGAGRVVKQLVNLDYNETTKTDNPEIKSEGGNDFVIVAAPEDILTSKTYDDNSNCLTETIHNDTPGAVGDQVVTRSYDALNRIITVTDPAGYPSNEVGAQFPDGFLTETKYDLNNNVRYVKNARGNETLTEYDEANRAIKQILPVVYDAESEANLNPEVITHFDTNSNIIQTVDARGLITIHLYDNLNRLQEIRKLVDVADDTKDIVLTKRFDANNNLIESKFFREDDILITKTTYDSLDRPLIIEDQEHYKSVVFCDLVGNKVKLFDKRANANTDETPNAEPQLRYFTQVEFDLANRMVKNTLPLIPIAVRDIMEDVNVNDSQPFSEVKYLKNNWVIETKDLNGNISETEYDGAGRKKKITTAIDQITEFEYDKSSNVLKQTVHNNNSGGNQITTYEYDKRNLLLKEILNEGEALQRIYSYRYDENGNKLKRTFPNGDVTDYFYDALDRLILEDYDLTGSENREYQYNNNGAVVIAKDETGSIEYDYDILGRQIKETKKDSLGNVLTVVESIYDKANNRIRCFFPNNNKTLVSFYDKRNLLKIMKGYHGKVSLGNEAGLPVETTTYTYNGNGQQASCTTPNGQTTTKTYDNADRILTSTTNANALDIYTVSYKRDAVGNQLETIETRYDRPDRKLGFVYDNVYRLITEIDDVSGAKIYTEYEYDLQGNRLNKIIKDANKVQTAIYIYTNDKLNRTDIVQYKEGNDLIKTYDYDYDDNGNRSLKKEIDEVNGQTVVDHTYTYDRENRLKTVEDPSGVIFTASYDYRTRRTAKEEGTSQAQTTLKKTNYIYDGGVICQETEEENGTDILVKQYVRGNGMGGGIGSVLYMERVQDTGSSSAAIQSFYDNLGQGTGTNGSGLIAEYYAYNAVGSVVANTDQQGFVIRENDFDAYGNQVREQDWTSDNFPIEFGGSQNDLLFSTKERDFSTGLDYFGFRYYDAVLGKFTTRDPSGYPDGPNNYLYCKNNPINVIDPLGLFSGEVNWHHLIQNTPEIRDLFKKHGWVDKNGEFDVKRFNKLRHQFGSIALSKDHAKIHSKGWRKDVFKKLEELAAKGHLKPGSGTAKHLQKALKSLKGSEKYRNLYKGTINATMSYTAWGKYSQKLKGVFAEAIRHKKKLLDVLDTKVGRQMIVDSLKATPGLAKKFGVEVFKKGTVILDLYEKASFMVDAKKHGFKGAFAKHFLGADPALGDRLEIASDPILALKHYAARKGFGSQVNFIPITAVYPNGVEKMDRALQAGRSKLWIDNQPRMIKSIYHLGDDNYTITVKMGKDKEWSTMMSRGQKLPAKEEK